MAGLLGDFENRILSPLFLGGAALMGGEGMGGAFRGMQMGGAFQDQRRQLAEQERQKQQFQGLLADPDVTGAVPAPMLRIAEMGGPQSGPGLLAQYLDPAREADLALKKAQLAKYQREGAQAAEASARQKALLDYFMSPQQAASEPVPASSTPVPSEGAARFSAPGLASQTAVARPPQTPQELFNALPPNKKAQAQIALTRGDMEEFGKIIGEGPPQLADNLTPGEKRVDQTFAKSYEDFVLSGGAADFDKNLKQMREVQKELTSGENLTGPVLGRMPDAVTSFTHPKAVDARQRVEEVVQRNLRIILGAQFTQKEGENLIARAYNPALDEATNAKRLQRLISSMEKMRDAKIQAMDYFERHGTMKGFRGTTQFSVNDLIADLDTPEQTTGGTGGFKYIGTAD